MPSTNSATYDLELVQVLFRHGDRTPERSETYPKDPYRSFDYEPFGHGQLTNDGKRRAFLLGEVLKIRYEKFIGRYEPDTVYAYSTSLDRCKASLMIVLATLFPPTGELIWYNELMWNPIPFECNVYDEEMFRSQPRDSRHKDLMIEAYKSPEIKPQTDRFDKILDYIVKKTGCPRKFEILSLIYQTIHSQMEFDLPMPDWCNQELLENMKDAHDIRLNVFSHTNELRKLIVGPFLKKLTDNMKENNDEMRDKKKKIYMYCAHELTVHALLKAHNYNIKEIDFCAAIIFEKLRGKDDDKQYVRLIYWPGKGTRLKTLKLKDCDDVFPFENYLEMVDPLLP